MTDESLVAGPRDAPPLTADGNSLSLHSAEPRCSPEVLSVILCSQSFPFGQSYEPKPATLLLESGEVFSIKGTLGEESLTSLW